MRHFNMSTKEADRVPTLRRLVDGEIAAKEAAGILELSVRHVRRLKKCFAKKGVAGLVHGNRGKESKRKIPEKKVQEIMDLVKQNYWDFGPTLAAEKLVENHGVSINHETLRGKMIEEGLWKPKRRRVVRIHQQRERRRREGELVQADGSPHAWFEDRGPNCTLLAFVDDATGKIKEAAFFESETTDAYFSTVKEYILVHGKPLALYVDRNSIFVTSNNKVNPGKPTQFTRAMDELKIEVILANSPQAKGRVEKLNSTLQDRLVKEMRLEDISTIKQGNEYLPGFIKAFNKKFAVEPREKPDVHRPLLPSEDLAKILVKKYTRVLSRNLEFQYENKLYQVKTERPTYTMRSAPITLTQDTSRKVRVYYKDKELKYKVLEKRPRQEATSAKEVNQKLDKITRKAQKPAKDHPWRYFSI